MVILACGIMLLSCKQKTDAVNYLDEAFIEVLDQELNGILDSGQKLEILSEGHDWTEGPLWLESENKLLFSDIPRNTIYAWSPKTGDSGEVHSEKQFCL